MLQNDNQSKFNKTSLDEAIYEYHRTGARLFNLLYYILIIEIALFIITIIIGCVVAFSSMAVFGRILEAIWNAL